MTTFATKVILVTGASSGIGADAARHLARLQGSLALVGRDVARLNQVADSIRADGSPEPLMIVADVSKDAERIVHETVQHFGKLDILINSAGILIRDAADTVNMDDYDRLMNINVRSIIELTKYAVPWLEKTKGNILNVSSISGLRAKPGSMIYCLSKAAVNQLTKCAALDLAPKGIRVNAIAPGRTRTPIFETNGLLEAADSEIFFDHYKVYPMGRVGEVSDTSNAIEFFIKESSSFLTGNILRVDGGALAGEQA